MKWVGDAQLSHRPAVGAGAIPEPLYASVYSSVQWGSEQYLCCRVVKGSERVTMQNT